MHLLRQKDPIKVPVLTLSSALVKICQIPHVISKPQVSFSLNFLSLFNVMKDKYFAQKEPIKLEILRISSAQVKIHQILANFSNNKSVLLRILHHSSLT